MYIDLEKNSMSWVLTRMGLEINQTKKWDETITLTTWSRGISGPFSNREFIFTDSNGNEFGRASSSFAPIDIKLRKLVTFKDPSFINDHSLPDKTVSLNLEKLIMPKELESNYKHVVRNTDLDINGPANNARYVECIYNSLPLDYFQNIESFNFQINYLGEAKLQDNVEIKSIHSDQKNSFFEGVDQKTGKSFFTAKLF